MNWQSFLTKPTSFHFTGNVDKIQKLISKITEELEIGKNKKGKSLSEFVILQKNQKLKSLRSKLGYLYYSPMIGKTRDGLETKFNRNTKSGLKPLVKYELYNN